MYVCLSFLFSTTRTANDYKRPLRGLRRGPDVAKTAVFFTRAGILATTLVESLRMSVELGSAVLDGLRDHKLAYNSSSECCLYFVPCSWLHLSDISYTHWKASSRSVSLSQCWTWVLSWAGSSLHSSYLLWGPHLKCDISLFLRVSAYGNNRSMGYLWIVTFVLHAYRCSPSLGGFVDEKRVTTVV